MIIIFLKSFLKLVEKFRDAASVITAIRIELPYVSAICELQDVSTKSLIFCCYKAVNNQDDFKLFQYMNEKQEKFICTGKFLYEIALNVVNFYCMFNL